MTCAFMALLLQSSNWQGKIRKVHSSFDEDKQIKVTEPYVVIVLKVHNIILILHMQIILFVPQDQQPSQQSGKSYHYSGDRD